MECFKETGGRIVYFIGIDGGGTKTDFLLADNNGNTVKEMTTGTISYKQIGMDKSIELLHNTILEMTDGVVDKEGMSISDVSICIAMPAFGESKTCDKEFLNRISEVSPYPTVVVNDCVAGWAGSLNMKAGINIVCGTGSIAYGRNDSEDEVRVGGWDENFSDEGSGFYLGMKAFQLFSKESDGRKEKGPLFDIFREEFGLKDDIDVIDVFQNKFYNDRTKTAGVQKLLLKAALLGDKEAVKLYEIAAEELSEIVIAAYRRLGFTGEALVSYSGGIFKSGDLILKPFKERLREYNIQLVKPVKSPKEGAVLIAQSKYKKVSRTQKS